ncbi:uracil phosphoribosyltransferase homolog isoform X2 [Pipra filicauda]|uniref:Uracil phosphoribosyltransferase homolog n=1 Tax=Pipra filicauda TaxID=649802 RepID=A0A6J2I497_9PASS|nr:uracil phosphoribosyltransferase homolog isoform X2 [Pipra filicauda]XP_051647670.1 uracil phosphoribosyltransferase homolog [Manacus candei]
MEAMPCQNQRLGPRPQEEPPPAATATAGGGSRLIRFAEPSEDSGCPSPDSSSSSSNGVVAAPPVPAGEGGAPAIGPQLKLLPMNDQLRELQTIIRDKKSSRGDFVFSADRLIRLVVEEGLNQLPYTECTVTTPTGHKYEGVRFEKGNCGVSIMRSGEAMEQGLRDCCRSIRIGKILIQSDEETQRAKVYYAKFPPDIYRRKVLLMYPILSTGNTVIEAVKVLVEHGVQPSVIILLSLFSTPHGAKSIIQEFPEITILTTEVHPVAPTHFGQKYFGTD